MILFIYALHFSFKRIYGKKSPKFSLQSLFVLCFYRSVLVLRCPYPEKCLVTRQLIIKKKKQPSIRAQFEIIMWDCSLAYLNFYRCIPLNFH